MAGRMPPSTSVGNPPAAGAAAAATSDAARNYVRLKAWIERECAECDAAIAEHRQQIDDYRSQKGRLEELQKKISHPIMVPFGSVGFMPGKLVRTNEVLVLLGANHFAECSVHDTGKIIDRRIREITTIVDRLEHQKRNARERLNFAQGLFGGATGGGGAKQDEPIEIREEYDEKKEAEARRKRAERAAAARAERKVPQATFENMMSRLDELEQQEEQTEGKKKPKVQVLDSDDEIEEEEQQTEGRKPKVQVLDSDDEIEEEEYVEQPIPPAPPRGVNPEEYKRLLARLDQLDAEETSDEDEEEEVDSDDVIEDVDEEMDSDDVSDTEEERRAKFEQMRKQMEAKEQRAMREREEEEEKRAAVHPRRLIEVIDDDVKPTVTTQAPTVTVAAATAQSITEQIPKMTVVSESDRVVDLVEYQNQQEEDEKAKENSPSRKLTHKRSVRFKKNLEAGPCEKSLDSDDLLPLSALDAQVNPRSILRNKSEESPIDKNAFSEMEDQRATTILPAGDAFSGCVVERQVVSSELPIVFKPVDEPPRRVSRFKLQRMQQATE